MEKQKCRVLKTALKEEKAKQLQTEGDLKATLEKMIVNQNLTNRIFQILIPTEDVVEIKKNKRTLKKRKFFPGYALATVPGAISALTHCILGSIVAGLCRIKAGKTEKLTLKPKESEASG